MGADMVTAVLVLHEDIVPDWEAARRAVAEIVDRVGDGTTDEQLLMLGDWFDSAEELRNGLLADVDVMAAAYDGNRRDVDWLEFREHRLYVTGGMSSGDSPTDVFGVIVRLDSYGIADAAGFGTKEAVPV